MKFLLNKRMRSVARLFIITFGSTFATEETSVHSKSVEPIQCSASSSDGLLDVWNRYVEGLRHGDLTRLLSIFADQGTFHMLVKPSGSGAETVRVQPFSEAIPIWVINPDSEAHGILGAIAVDYNMATIRGTLDFGPDHFADVLSLYCANGRWQIVSKLTYGRVRQTR